MSNISTKNQVWYFVEETTVDTEKAPSAAGEAVAVIEGGELIDTTENLERAIITSGLGKAKPLGGMSNFSGSVSVEAKAGDAPGSAPEYDPMLQTMFGVRTLAAAVTSKSGSPTTTEIPIEDADIASFAVNDIVVVKESEAYHVSPIASIVTTPGSATITLKYAAAGAFTSEVVIEAFVNYQSIDSAHKTASVFREMEGDSDIVTDKMSGARASSMALSNFTTGQLPQFDFAFQGIAGSRVLTDSGLTPTYDDAQPPVTLGAYVRANGAVLCLNDFAFSLEDNIGQVTCVGEDTGVQSQRVVDRVVNGTINPYKEDDSLTLYNLAKNRTTFELFVSSQVPSTTTGEWTDAVSYYFPTCVITEAGQGDVNGIVTEAFSFSAFSDDGATEIIMSFS